VAGFRKRLAGLGIGPVYCAAYVRAVINR